MPLTYPQPADRPLVLGHRGASAHAGDNTLEAFRLAVAQGADGVELDVRFAGDGEIILSHDPSLPGIGLVSDHSLDELRSVVPDLATLDESAEVLGDLIINVEIKNDPSEPDFDPDHRMADDIAEWVRQGDRYGRVVVTSFNPDTVARVRFVDDEIVTGQLLDRTADLADAIPEAAAAGHSYVAPYKRLLRAAAAKTVHLADDHGIGIVVWTVDRARALRRLRDAGVAAVITNDPAAALEVYAEAAS